MSEPFRYDCSVVVRSTNPHAEGEAVLSTCGGWIALGMLRSDVELKFEAIEIA